MLSEIAIAAVFIAATVAGFKRRPWITVVALGGHGVMDDFHHHLVQNTGVPQVWPGFCMTFDVTAAAIVALAMLARARGSQGNPIVPVNATTHARQPTLSTEVGLLQFIPWRRRGRHRAEPLDKATLWSPS